MTSAPSNFDWKRHHANESEKVLEVEVVARVMQEFADNMGFDLNGLPGYGLCKIVSYAAQVARAQALGFDPALLLMDEGEANEQLLAVARAAVAAGKPTWTIRGDDVQRID